MARSFNGTSRIKDSPTGLIYPSRTLVGVGSPAGPTPFAFRRLTIGKV